MSTPVCVVTPKTNQPASLVEVDFQIRQKNFSIYFKSDDNTVLYGNNEAFIACMLLPCMRVGGGTIECHGTISPRFLASLETIQELYREWDPTLGKARILGMQPKIPLPSTDKRVGAFFTGGVDSLYTFLNHHDEITDLIFAHGLDIKLNNRYLRNKTSEMIRKVAAEFGKNVIEIETNVLELFDSYVNWGELGHGAALAAIGYLLSPTMHRIYIPASYHKDKVFPWGSHPSLDPLWSSETLEFIHDGCETRVDKVAYISQFDVALQTLRVCWRNPKSSYNCGKCEKCIRTMINLKLCNSLEKCPTFDHPLTIQNIRNIVVEGKGSRIFIQENLDALKSGGKDPSLVEALEFILNRPGIPLKNRIILRLKKLKKSLRFLMH